MENLLQHLRVYQDWLEHCRCHYYVIIKDLAIRMRAAVLEAVVLIAQPPYESDRCFTDVVHARYIFPVMISWDRFETVVLMYERFRWAVEYLQKVGDGEPVPDAELEEELCARLEVERMNGLLSELKPLTTKEYRAFVEKNVRDLERVNIGLWAGYESGI